MAPKRSAPKRNSSSNYLMAKIAKLDEEYNNLGEQVAQKQQDRDIASIVLELQNRPEKISGCLRAVQGNAFVPKDQLELEFTPGTNHMYKVPKQFLEHIILERAPAMAKNLQNIGKASKLGTHRLFYRAALADQGTEVSTKNKAACDQILQQRIKDVNFDFKLLRFLESGDIDWTECGVFRLMPPRPAGHTAAWRYETLQFHNGKAEVSMTAMNLTIDERACIAEPWSIKRATLVLNKGTEMETKKKCIDLFKKDAVVTGLLQFAIKKAQVDGGSSADESGDDGPADVSSTAKPSTPRTKLKSEVTPLKNAPIGARKALSPAQRAVLDALKTGAS